MTNRRIKFKIAIKELSVEFEGDIQTAERIQEQVTGAINNLATAPNRMIGSGQREAVSSVIESTPSRRRRRRRVKSKDIDESILDAEVIDEHNEDAPSRRPARRDGPTSLIQTLRDDKFFAQRRTAGQIREELSRRGHSYKTNEASPQTDEL